MKKIILVVCSMFLTLPAFASSSIVFPHSNSNDPNTYNLQVIIDPTISLPMQAEIKAYFVLNDEAKSVIDYEREISLEPNDELGLGGVLAGPSYKIAVSSYKYLVTFPGKKGQCLIEKRDILPGTDHYALVQNNGVLSCQAR